MAGKKTPSDEDKDKKTSSSDVDEDKEGDDNEQSVDIPDKFQGKSVGEVAKAYSELEKKLGEQSSELGKYRDEQEKMALVLQAIWGDPELYRQVEAGIRKISGGEPSATSSASQQKKVPSTDEKGQAPARLSEERLALENQIISDFERRYGLDRLQPEERRKQFGKMATVLGEMIDPGGRKTTREVLTEIPLQRLSVFLDNAYFLANRDTLLTKSKQEGALTRYAADSAKIGTMSSSSEGEGTIELTPTERKVAERLGISPEKFAKQKQRILQETERYGR